MAAFGIIGCTDATSCTNELMDLAGQKRICGAVLIVPVPGGIKVKFCGLCQPVPRLDAAGVAQPLPWWAGCDMTFVCSREDLLMLLVAQNPERFNWSYNIERHVVAAGVAVVLVQPDRDLKCWRGAMCPHYNFGH